MSIRPHGQYVQVTTRVTRTGRRRTGRTRTMSALAKIQVSEKGIYNTAWAKGPMGATYTAQIAIPWDDMFAVIAHFKEQEGMVATFRKLLPVLLPKVLAIFVDDVLDRFRGVAVADPLAPAKLPANTELEGFFTDGDDPEGQDEVAPAPAER